MIVMYLAWKLWKRTHVVKLSDMDLETDVYKLAPEEKEMIEEEESGWKGKVGRVFRGVGTL